MKTSIKMLLVFVGIVLLLVLASDVVLWAYFKKGINGDGEKLQFGEKIVDNAIVLKPFKAIVLSTNRANRLNLIADSNYRIEYKGFNGEQLPYRLDGDTLYILPNNAYEVIVRCPSVQFIRAAVNNLSLEMTRFIQPSLSVVGLNDFSLQFTNVDIKKLSYKGGQSNSVLAQMKSNIDSVNIDLGLYGNVKFLNTTINSLSVKADSLLNLNLDKSGLLKLEKLEQHYTMKGDSERFY